MRLYHVFFLLKYIYQRWCMRQASKLGRGPQYHFFKGECLNDYIRWQKFEQKSRLGSWRRPNHQTINHTPPNFLYFSFKNGISLSCSDINDTHQIRNLANFMKIEKFKPTNSTINWTSKQIFWLEQNSLIRNEQTTIFWIYELFNRV